ncbi:MAG: hypothetical protein CMH57_01660 [Myxococcales bacterium]|nr:hypothetical protein [Myxococcales bacterium]
MNVQEIAVTPRSLIPLAPLLLIALTSPTRADEPRATASGESLAAPVHDLRYAITMKRGFSPYTLVRYTLRVRDGVGTIGVTKELPGSYGRQERLGLLPADALKRLMGELGACDFATLPSVRRARGAEVVWGFEARSGDAHREIEVPDPERLEDPRYGRCLDALRTTAEAEVGAMAFRNVFFDAGEFGYLQVSSDPVARVIIDGVDTGQESPLMPTPLAVGEHEIEFVDPTRGVRREYKVTIMPEMTTNLTVDLR